MKDKVAIPPALKLSLPFLGLGVGADHEAVRRQLGVIPRAKALSVRANFHGNGFTHIKIGLWQIQLQESCWRILAGGHGGFGVTGQYF